LQLPNSFTFSDESLFIRRIPQNPDFLIPNVMTGKRDLKANAAFQFDEDGMSVSSAELLDQAGFDARNFCDWNRYSAVKFPASAPRSTRLADVVYDPVDGHLGFAHALVVPIVRLTRESKRDLRVALAFASRWLAEDPNFSELGSVLP